LNLKIFRFETARIFIIIHFRKKQKRKENRRKKEKGKIPVARRRSIELHALAS
jgi:hypothetical protein